MASIWDRRFPVLSAGALTAATILMALQVTSPSPALASACASVADSKGLKTAMPQQGDLAEVEKALGKLTFRDNPLFADKVKAGANAAITQFFFNPDAYFHFVEATQKLGARAPVVPGIMPFHNFAKIAQFAARDGIEIPRWVALKMEGFMDDAASIRAFGIDVVTALCERLIEGGAPGIHFYTMNQSALTLEICQRLGR